MMTVEISQCQHVEMDISCSKQLKLIFLNLIHSLCLTQNPRLQITIVEILDIRFISE